MQAQGTPSRKGDSRRLVKTRSPGIYKRVAVDSEGGETVQGYAVVYRAGGKQRREYAKTLDAARRLQAGRKSEVDRGEFVAESSITLHAYLGEWIERYRGKTARRGFRENTRAEYRRLLDYYALRFFEPRLRLREVTPRHMAQFVAWLADERKQGRRLADSTINNAVAPVRAALSTAQREGLIRHNPAHGLVIGSAEKPTEEPEERVKVLTREQLRMLLTIAPDRHRLLLELLATTGLRISEAIGLQRRHVITEPERVQRNGGWVTLPERVCVRRAIVRGRVGRPKSRFGTRDVAIPPAFAARLADHLAALPDASPDALVFPNERGAPLDPDNLRARMLRPLGGEIGAPWIGFHTLRHTHASLQLARGVNIKQLQRALGHHSASFTLDVYSHLLPGDEAPPLVLAEEFGRVNVRVNVPHGEAAAGRADSCMPMQAEAAT